jgi:hypothetical protein
MSKLLLEQIEKEFDEKLLAGDFTYEGGEMDDEKVKSFLKSSLLLIEANTRKEVMEEVDRKIVAWKYKYDNYMTMMDTPKNFKKGELARELASDLQKALKEE